MANAVFYFSGTGNSLAAARDIAGKLGDTSVVSITKAIKDGVTDLPYERIGFVFPVYYYFVPGIVKDFIKKLNFTGQQYVFGVITFGGAYGMVFDQLEQCIRERGGVLNAAFPVRMPGNYIDKYGAFPDLLQRMLFKRSKRKTSRISRAVMEKSVTRIPRGSFISRMFADSASKAVANFGKNARNFHTDSKCSGCGICERLCPSGNIRLVDKQPQWSEACEHCVACIQWCPVHAIQYADKTQKRKHYNHPGVKVSDML